MTLASKIDSFLTVWLDHKYSVADLQAAELSLFNALEEKKGYSILEPLLFNFYNAYVDGTPSDLVSASRALYNFYK